MKKYVVVLLVALLFLGGCSKIGISDEDSISILDKTVAKIKEAYGDDYGPNMELSKDQLEEVYSITMDNVSYFIAEGSMMTNSTDMLIGLIAKDGKVNEVQQEVEAYREYLLNDSFQYPMNMPRIQASEVIVNENIVFFIVLGKIDDREDVSEEELLAFATEQTQIAVDVIQSNQQ